MKNLNSKKRNLVPTTISIIYVLPLLLLAVNSFARGSASGTLSCSSSHSTLSASFNDSEADGFVLDDSATITIHGMESEAGIFSSNAKEGSFVGPSQFTLKSRASNMKIVVIASRPINQIEGVEPVELELFDNKGNSFAVEQGNCTIELTE